MSVRIAVIGTGYVGLVTGSCLAEIGHHVICIDRDARKIEGLRQGLMPIFEPGLDSVVERNVKAGRLTFSSTVPDAVRDREAIFICVGTPSDPHSGQADLRHVFGVAEELASTMPDDCVVITKSTVPVGTNRRVGQVIREKAPAARSFAVASNPEFLREGAAVSDFLKPDRIVVGVGSERASAVMRRIYSPLVNQRVQYFETGVETAELIKYAANGFLAVKLSFINEVADLCEKVGADVEDVATGIGLDSRIGRAFLKVGPGWGGSCFPKDTLAFMQTAKAASVPLRIVEAAVLANQTRKRDMVNRIVALCGGSVAGKKIAVLGLTFKGQTDDMRDSPSLEILPALVAQGAMVHAYDPSGTVQAPPLLPQVRIEQEPIAAVSGADALVILTEWKEFRTYDFRAFARLMKGRLLIDLRNHLDRKDIGAANFYDYHALGRGAPETGAI